MIKNRIKEYRAKHDMTQEQLARLVDVRRETIGNLESAGTGMEHCEGIWCSD